MNVKPILLIIVILFAFMISISQVKSAFSLDVRVKTDNSDQLYPYNGLVKILGNVTYEKQLVQNGLVGIQVDDIPSDSIPRTILIRTLSLNQNQSLPFSLEIISLFSHDDYANPTTSVKRGKYLWFNMTIENKGLSPKDVCLCITVADRRLVPLSVDNATVTISAGRTGGLAVRVKIPTWAAVGTAYIYGSVLTSYPKNLGIPLCPEKISHFDIEQPSITPPNQPTQNGTYAMSYRLRPDMAWGRCQISASAWSSWTGGFTGFGSASFEYWLPGDFDRDRDVDIYDAVGLLQRYGVTEEDPSYRVKYDIATPPATEHADGVLNVYDAVLMLTYYGVRAIE
jgi:hypothetical protein